MKQLHILLFFISLFLNVAANSQQKNDTVTFKENFGLRIGADILKPSISFFDKNNKGIELTGDVRFYKNYYAAVELGFEDKTSNEDYLNFTTKGSFIKIGINYNAYQNWKGMANEIYVGARYGFSFFKQTLNNYTPNIKGTYFTPNQITSGTEFKDLNAHWIEFVAGMKVETLKNLYLGTQISVKKMISTKEPTNFKNLYAPGFNRIYLNNMGIGFTYSLSYLIPIIKKNK